MRRRARAARSSSPSELRVVTKPTLEGFDLDAVERDGSVVITPQREVEPPNIGGAVGVAAVVGFVTVTILADEEGDRVVDRATDWLLGLGVAVVLFAAIIIVQVRSPSQLLTAGRRVAAWFRQMLVLVIVLAVCVGLPLMATVLTSELGSLKAAWSALWDDSSPAGRQDRVLAMSHLLQVTFMALAALLPALLYYLFDRQQSATLRDNFVRNAFRLDSSLGTMAELRAKYGRRMADAYGAGNTPGAWSGTGTCASRRSCSPRCC